MVQLISGGGDGQEEFKKDGAVIKMVNKEKMLKKRGTKKKPLLFLAPEKPEEVKKEENSRLFKEGPLMTKCDGVWVKRQFVEEYEKLKVSLENQILLSRERKSLLYKAKKKAHKQLLYELNRDKDKKAKKSKSFKKTLPPPKAMSLKETKELSRNFEEKKGKAGSGKKKMTTKAEEQVEEDSTEPKGKKKKSGVEKEVEEDNQEGKEVTKQKSKGKKGAVITKKTSKIEDGETPAKLTKKRKQGKDGDFTEENTGAKKTKKGGKKGSKIEELEDEILKEKKAKKRTALKEKKAMKKAALLAENAKRNVKAKKSPVLECMENESMTNIDGFWIRKESGKNLEDLRNKKKKLRSEQRKLMKKLKRSELRKE